MSKTASEYLVEALEKTGVKRVYGVVGDSLNGFTDALRRRKSIDWIHMRHEEAAAFAAGAEAHLTGSLAVCAGSCGPGNLHLINGLFDCQRNGVPVLAIAAHIPSSEIGIDYFQATHPENLFRDCSHYVELVSNPKQLPQILRRAIRVAIAKRGVAVVVLPGDVALMKIDADVPEWIAPTEPVLRPSEADIGHLANFLNKASRVTLFCGAGCAGAHAEVIELARKLKAPIVHAFRGKEFVEYDNPYDVGMTGLVGFASGYAAMKNCDALLMLGTDFPYRAFYPEQAKIAQVDVRPEALGNRCSLHLGLLGNVKDTLDAVLPSIEEKTNSSHLSEALSTRKRAETSTPWRRVVRTATLFIRNMSPAWSANWLLTTRSSPAMSERRSSGRRAISRSTAGGALSGRLITDRWRMRCCKRSAHRRRIRNARSSQCQATAVSA